MLFTVVFFVLVSFFVEGSRVISDDMQTPEKKGALVIIQPGEIDLFLQKRGCNFSNLLFDCISRLAKQGDRLPSNVEGWPEQISSVIENIKKIMRFMFQGSLNQA